MVGTARFELATSRTPSVRATRLRYVPTVSVALLRLIAQIQGYHLRSNSVKKLRSPSRRSSSIFRLNCEVAACSPIDPTCPATSPPSPLFSSSFKCRRAPAIVNPSSYNSRLIFRTRSTSSWRYRPMPVRAFHRLQHGKFRLPIAQHKWFQGSQPAHLADSVVSRLVR